MTKPNPGSPPLTARAHAAWAQGGLAALALTLAATAGSACASRQELAAELRVATAQDQLPKVVACWETAFEAAGFAGELEVVVDFTVTPSTGQIQDAVVQEIHGPPTGGEAGPAADGDHELSDCLVKALNQSSLKPGALSCLVDLHVVGFRFAFTGAAQQARGPAGEDAPTLLIGPRAERCNGLYGHDPPLDAAAVHQELAEAEAAADRAEADQDQLGRARALQKSYDLALELTDRLELDAAAEDLTDEGHDRIVDELKRARGIAAAIGAKIGCTPPAR